MMKLGKRERTQKEAGRKSGSGRRMRLAGICAALCLGGTMLSEAPVQAASAGGQVQAVYIPMPGFVVEQWSVPKPMKAAKDAAVMALADNASAQLGTVMAGQDVFVWGQTDTGWYFTQIGDALGYVRNEVLNEGQPVQPVQAAGIVFIGDSRMVTLKEAVEKKLGVCPAAVIAKNGSRYEWFHDTAIPQADRVIGNGSRVVVNMGVNDLNDADKYAQDMNYWGAVWSARGAQVYYASVNPVWDNPHGMTPERVKLFNDRLKGQLIPQIVWLDSHSYLMGAGVHAYDGIHYKDDTNLVLYQYYLTMIGAV